MRFVSILLALAIVESASRGGHFDGVRTAQPNEASTASPLDFSQAATNERAVAALANIAGGGDIDHASMLPNMYSLLQLSSRMLDMERLEAGQYFELIEDPLMNLFVPVLIQVAMDIIKKPVIDEVCGALADALASTLAEPMGQAIFPGAEASFIEIDTPQMQEIELSAGVSGLPKAANARRALQRVFSSFPLVAELVARAKDGASAAPLFDASSSIRGQRITVADDPSSQSAGLSRLLSVLESAGLSLAEAASLAHQAMAASGSSSTESASVSAPVRSTPLGSSPADSESSAANEDEVSWLFDSLADDGARGTSGEEGDELSLAPSDAEPGDDAPLHTRDGWRASSHETLSSSVAAHDEEAVNAGAKADPDEGVDEYELHDAVADDAPTEAPTRSSDSSKLADTLVANPFSVHDLHPGLSASERWAVTQQHQRLMQQGMQHREESGAASGGASPPHSWDVDLASFLETESGVDVTVCSRLTDERACLTLEPPASAGRCSWCAKPGASKGKCVPCLPARVAPLLKQGYQCGRDQAFCAALEAHYAPYFHQPVPGGVKQTGTVELPPPAAGAPKGGGGGGGKPAALPASSRSDWRPSDDSKLPQMPPEPKGEAPPNEAAAQNDKTAEDATAAPLAHLLHNNLVPLLRSRLRKKLVRTVMREAAAPATVGAVERLHAGLPQLLVRSIAGATTRRLSVELTRTLTSVLVPTLSEALARHPAVDIVCGLCDAHGLYCDACKGARRQDGTDTAVAAALAEDLSQAASRALAGSGLLDVAVAQSLAEEAASVVRQGKPEPKSK